MAESTKLGPRSPLRTGATAGLPSSVQLGEFSNDTQKDDSHYEDVVTVHELAFSCYRQVPLLTNDVWRQMLSESITRATDRHGFQLIAFVYMPEHVHLLVLPTRQKSSISSLLKAFRELTR